MRRILFGFGVIVLVAGCSDPLRNMPRLSDVAVNGPNASVTQAPSEARATGGGLFGRLLNRALDDPTNAAVEAALAQTAETDAVLPVAVAPQVELDAPRRGLAGLFRRTPNSAPAPRNGPDTQTVPAGTILPFGQIARVCDVRGAALGTRIEADAGFRVYDTDPNATTPRAFYVTGFDDKCARTFTGAVVVTGDVETHEFVRYRPSNQNIAYTQTDTAYETLKARVCRVDRGEPCGANTPALNQNTQFITVYNFFGGTFNAVPTKWAQILIHDGAVMAMSIKDGEQ